MLAGAMKKKTNSTSAGKSSSTAPTSLEWYQDFTRHVELRDFAPRTRECYLHWAREIHDAFPRRDITRLKEGEALDFLVALRNERGFADSTVNQAACALRALYRDHLGRDWKGWSAIKIRRPEQLPNIISRPQAARLLASVEKGRFRAMFTVMYHCGLRISEAIALKPAHIDSARRVLRVVGSKSLRDREVPVSDAFILRQRAFWLRHRNPEWMFPSPGRGWKGAGKTLAAAMHRSRRPVSDSSVEAAMRATVLSLGWDKRRGFRNITCHTLRHSYATHLLDAGVSIRLVSHYLGHSSLQHTLKYLHLTEASESAAREVIAGLPGL